MTVTATGPSTSTIPLGVEVAGLANAWKVFGSTVAVSDTSFQLRTGEVMALIGENGAGKSTCVKMLGGLYQPDRGSVILNGEEVVITSPLDATRRGIAVVHQHPGLFGELSLAENVFAGHPLTDSRGLVDHGEMRVQASELLHKLGLDKDPMMPARGLRTSEQQMVEIAKALAANAKVLILDEPTAALTTNEVDRLFQVVFDLKAQGVAAMFVGHRLEEVSAISDQICIMRDGSNVAYVKTSETNRSEIVHHMVGRTFDGDTKRTPETPGEVVLELEHLTIDGEFDDISLTVRAGEVVGMAGLVGAGRTEVARAVFGVTQPDSGVISYNGEVVEIRSAADAIKRGIAYVSEDRRGQSVVEDFAILDNASLPVIERTTSAGLIRRQAELDQVVDPLERMRLRFASYLQPIRGLSGGNQQKVVLAKWLATAPRLLILDEPTQGIDVQAKDEVHTIISELAAQGIAILVISSDMPELIALCDRVYVLQHGEMVTHLAGDEINQINIGMAATGTVIDDAPSPEIDQPTPPAHDRATPAGPSVTDQPDAETVVDLRADGAVADRPDDRPPSTTAQARWKRLVKKREFGLAVALASVIIPLTIVNPNFYSGANVRDLLIYASLIGIVALGEMLVVLTRNIDLSVASTLGLAAYVSAAVMRADPTQSILVGIGVALLVGLACGALNGALVSYGGVPSIVVTLGTLAVYRGVLSRISSGDRIQPTDVDAGRWLDWTRYQPLGIPIIAWVAAAIFLLAGFVLRRTRQGRELFATGSNPEGAELVGIRTNRRMMAAFTIGGLLAGFVGSMWASFYPYVDGQVAYGLELTVISGVVVGGVALRGGAGTVSGVALGVFGLLAIRKALTIAGVDDKNLMALYGAAIIVAVTVDVLVFSDRRKKGTA